MSSSERSSASTHKDRHRRESAGQPTVAATAEPNQMVPAVELLADPRAASSLGYARAAAQLQRAYGNQTVQRLLSQRPAGPGGVIQRFKIYPPGVLGTPGIEVANSDSFKKHIREWERMGDDFGLSQIRRYLKRLEDWLALVQTGEVKPDQDQKERENVEWAVGWVKNRLQAATPPAPKDSSAAEPKAKSGGPEPSPKDSTGVTPKKSPGSASSETITVPQKAGRTRTVNQRLEWVRNLEQAAKEGRTKLQAILDADEGGKKVLAILQLGGEGGEYIETKTSGLISDLATRITKIYELSRQQDEWLETELAKLVIGESPKKTLSDMRDLLDSIDGIYGWAMDIEDLNELQMSQVKKSPPVRAYDNYDVSRAIRSIVNGKRIVRSPYRNREGFLAPGSSYLEYQVGEGGGGGAGERRVVVESGNRSVIYYTNGATHDPQNSKFQAFDAKSLSTLGFLYVGDRGALRSS